MGCRKTYSGYLRDSHCLDCNDNNDYLDASCISYTGPNLVCSTINSGDDLETSLQKIDTVLCSVVGDYSSYNMNCLPAYWGSQILTEETFVDAITKYACQLRGEYDTFVSNTYSSTISTIQSTLNSVTNPNLTCASASVTIVDNLSTILTKYCTKFGDIDDALDITSVIWNNCQTVPVPPTTLSAAFQLLADQICAIEVGQQSLPTFNNVGSCLPAPVTSNDSLEVTVNKIKTRLCQSPTYLSTNISWGCVGSPASTTSIEVGLQQIVTKVNQLTQASPTFDPGDFTIAATDPGDPCSGITVSLATPINQDRFVAVTAGDTSPGVLQDKLVQGSGVTLDYVTNSGKLTISASGTADTFEVKANSLDDDPGYLDQKLNGVGSKGVSIVPSYNPSTKKVDLMTSLDENTLFNVLLDALDSNPTLYAKFCEKVRNCPSGCDAPTNVQAVQTGISTTTTSTTTTTTEP